MGVLLGEKVRYAREKKGLTARELAEKAKITQPYISEIENGKRTPSAKTIMGLAHALDVPGEFLLRNDVKTIEEMNLHTALKEKIDSSEYIPYFVTVEKAISGGLTPQELENAIKFVLACKQEKPSGSQ